MMRIPLFYVKDKQAFSKRSGSLKFLGKPIDIVKKLHKQGAELVHIIDLDAENGNLVNFDIYDHLTYLVHIQVEGARDEHAIKALLAVNARVVIVLPTTINLKNFRDKKRLVVGKVTRPSDVSSDVFDIIYAGEDAVALESLLKTKRRIIIPDKLKTKADPRLFGVLYEI